MGDRIMILGPIKHPIPIEWRKTYSCCILTHLPWARLHPAISQPLKRKRICYSFILFKIVYHVTMVTSQKHYMNNPIQLNIIHYCVRCNTYGHAGRVYNTWTTWNIKKERGIRILNTFTSSQMHRDKHYYTQTNNNTSVNRFRLFICLFFFIKRESGY